MLLIDKSPDKTLSNFWGSRHLVGVFVTSGREIKHADPHAAAAFGLMMVIGTLWEVVVNSGDIKLWKGLLPKDDRTLKGELTQSFLSYLGVERKAR
jgi:hypothetical protein